MLVDVIMYVVLMVISPNMGTWIETLFSLLIEIRLPNRQKTLDRTPSLAYPW